MLKWIILCIALWVVVIAHVCLADEIDDLIPAIIQVESGGNPNAVSPCGAVGLMQVTTIVLKEWNTLEGKRCFISPFGKSNTNIYEKRYIDIADLYNPVINKRIGEWYLRRIKNNYLKDKYTIERLLACYNGGYGRLKKNNFDINKMPKETRNYIKKVLKLYERRIK